MLASCNEKISTTPSPRQNSTSLNQDLSSSPKPVNVLPALKPIDLSTGKAEGFSESTDIPVFLDFGLMDDPSYPCFCVEGPCKQSPPIPKPVLTETWNHHNLPKKKTIDFTVDATQEKYQLFLYTKGKDYIRVEITLNGKQIVRHIQGVDNILDRFRKLHDINLNTENRLEIKIVTNNPQDLQVTMSLRPDDIRFKYCLGMPQDWTDQSLKDWHQMQGIFSKNSVYRNPEGRYSDYNSLNDNLGSMIEFEDYILLWNVPLEVIKDRYQFEDYSPPLMELKPDPKLLSRIARYVNLYHQFGNKDLKAISFSSPGSMYAFAIDADFKDLGLKGYSNPGFNFGPGNFYDEIYGEPYLDLEPSPTPSSEPSSASSTVLFFPS